MSNQNLKKYISYKPHAFRVAPVVVYNIHMGLHEIFEFDNCVTSERKIFQINSIFIRVVDRASNRLVERRVKKHYAIKSNNLKPPKIQTR